MSQELERVYTINLGKVKLSQSQHRAVRAINMIREFARHHMKVETIKIEEDLAREVWARGVRSPPRKVRVRMSKTEEGYVLVSRYDEDAEVEVNAKKVSSTADAPAKEESAADAPAKEESAADAPAKEESAADAPAKEESAADAPAKEESAADAPADKPTKTD